MRPQPQNIASAKPHISNKGITTGQITGQAGFPTSFLQMLGNSQPPQTSTTAQAGIAWVLFDERFKVAGAGFDAVGPANTLKTHSPADISVPKNGYIYLFASNESQLNVFFDNFQVIHTRGRILEETHYYPFGLTMQGISSKAAGSLTNRYKFNGKELNNQEFADGSGLEMYDFGARNYDPQIGRWHTVDPLASKFPHQSPYISFDDNPINKVDPDGRAAKSVAGPTDDFRLNKDGSLSLLGRTADKSHSFYNENGQFLFKIGEKLGVREDWNNLSGEFQKEVAWSTAKVGLQVNGDQNLRTYMKSRADEVGWNSSVGIGTLVDLGKKNEHMLAADVVFSFTPIPISQNYREGKPAPLTGIIPWVKEVDRFYPILTNGRDLQHDITHPRDVINSTKNIQGVSLWEQIKSVWNQGIRDLVNWPYSLKP